MAADGSETHLEALSKCLDDVEHGCRPLELEPNVRAMLSKASLPEFIKHHHEWHNCWATVRRSATFIGKFAAQFAEFRGAKSVSEEDAKNAVRVVKGLCPAKFGWCPDV